MLTKHSNDRLVGFAQTAISVLFLAGYFIVLYSVLSGRIKTPPEWKDVLIALLGVITGSIGTIIGFWFSRSRPQGT